LSGCDVGWIISFSLDLSHVTKHASMRKGASVLGWFSSCRVHAAGEGWRRVVQRHWNR